MDIETFLTSKEHPTNAWTPITSIRGVGEVAIGINQLDSMAGLLKKAYPDHTSLIDDVITMVEEGLDPNEGAHFLQRIEAQG